jgi:flagellar FliL protein
MSKAPAKAEAAEGEAPAKGGKKKLIIIIVAVLVLAIAGGAFMLMGKKKHAEAKKARKRQCPTSPPRSRWTLQAAGLRAAGAIHGQPGARRGRALPAIHDGAAGRRRQGGRLPQALHARAEAPHHHAAVVQEALRSRHAEGREELADEIKEEANDVLGYAPNPKKKNKRNRPEDDGPVLAVLFNQFIVQ